MKTGINAILIHEDDNVVTVLVDIEKDDVVVFQKGDEIITLNVIDKIPVYHKTAVTDLKKGTAVLKYGQVIGKAIAEITRGSHVHDHNILSPDI